MDSVSPSVPELTTTEVVALLLSLYAEGNPLNFGNETVIKCIFHICRQPEGTFRALGPHAEKVLAHPQMRAIVACIEKIKKSDTVKDVKSDESPAANTKAATSQPENLTDVLPRLPQRRSQAAVKPPTPPAQPQAVNRPSSATSPAFAGSGMPGSMPLSFSGSRTATPAPNSQKRPTVHLPVAPSSPGPSRVPRSASQTTSTQTVQGPPSHQGVSLTHPPSRMSQPPKRDQGQSFVPRAPSRGPVPPIAGVRGVQGQEPTSRPIAGVHAQPAAAAAAASAPTPMSGYRWSTPLQTQGYTQSAAGAQRYQGSHNFKVDPRFNGNMLNGAAMGIAMAPNPRIRPREGPTAVHDAPNKRPRIN